MTTPTDDESTWAYPDPAAGLAAFREKYGQDPDSTIDLALFRKRGRRVGDLDEALVQEPRPAEADCAATSAPATASAIAPAIAPVPDPAPAAGFPNVELVLPFIKGQAPVPDGMTQLEAYGIHAMHRARERYRINPGPSELASLALAIGRGEGVRVGRTGRGRNVFDIPFMGHRVRVAYDPEACAVVTFLPPVEAATEPVLDPKTAANLKLCPTHGAYSPAEPDCPVCRASAAPKEPPPGHQLEIAQHVDEPMPEFTEEETAAALAPGRPGLTRPAEYGNNNPASSTSTTTRRETNMAGPTTAPVQAPKPAAAPVAAAGPRPAASPRPAAPGGSPVGLTIARAEKRAGRLRVCVTGPSGSGKSYSALLIAAGIVGDKPREDGRPRVLAVDTENASLADYGANADGSWPIVPFDVVELRPEYTVQKYLEAYRMAEANGYEVVIFDSLTHAWAGSGGLLEQKGRLDARGGNSYTNWAKVDPDFNLFREMILNNRIHLVATMRSKMDYTVDDKGKPTKIGLAPIMRDGMEYEFTVVYDLDLTHQAAISKHRTGALYADRKLFVPSIETGKELISWRMSGAPEQEPPKQQTAAAAAAPAAGSNGGGITMEDRKVILDIQEKLGLKANEVKATLNLPLPPAQLTAEQGHAMREYLENAAKQLGTETEL